MWSVIGSSVECDRNQCGVCEASDMEHYKKKTSRYYDDKCGPSDMRITGTGKPHDLCTRVTHKLEVCEHVKHVCF